MFLIDFDEDQRLLVATVEGYWTMKTLAEYEAALLPMLRRVHLRHRFFRMLTRGAAMPVQSAEVSKGVAVLSKDLVRLCPGPIAFLVGSALNKIQATRVLSHERICIFRNEADARRWLFSVDA